MYIVYLPPNFKDSNYKNSTIDLNIKRDPQVTVKRIHKSTGNGLVVYEIETLELNCTNNYSSSEFDGNVSIFQVPNQPITTVSSQTEPCQIRSFYFDLNFTPIDQLQLVHLNSNFVSIFGVLLEISRINEVDGLRLNNFACTEIILFDFEIGKRVSIKLWRGLAAWYSSLSIGCRLQIRTLTLKTVGNVIELHSCSSTEIHLLAQGPRGKDKPISSRAGHLNEKETFILNFLNHQSLLISYPKDSSSASCDTFVSLEGPFYLEYSCDCWILQGFEQNLLVTISFLHLDAKIWQKLLEIIENIKECNFNIKLTSLRPNSDSFHDFIESSSIIFHPKNSSKCSHYKKLNWTDLCSSKVINYGVYLLEALIDSAQLSNASEESLGNLSILPDSSNTSIRLKCPIDFKYFIYPENWPNDLKFEGNCVVSVLVLLKTILNDENINEIVRKNVYIIKTL